MREAGRHLRGALGKISSPYIGNLRGVGLLVGLEIVRPDGAPDAATAARCVTEGLQRGVLLLAGGRLGNVISLAPPFDLSPGESDFLARQLAEILG